METRVSRSRAAALTCLVAGLLPLVVAPSLPGCACSDIGCTTPATRSLDLPADVTLPAGSTITACFNDFCASSTLSEALPPGAGVGLGFPFDAAVDAVYLVGYIDQGRLDVQYWIQQPGKLRAGDRYRLTVIAPSGEIIADDEATAAGYDTYDPDPSWSCGVTCRRARFP